MFEEVLNIKCRTCFNAAKGLKSLTAKSTNNKCYAELLEDITNLSILDDKYKELPQFICGYCSKRLKSAYAFVQQAKSVNEKLLVILNKKDDLKQELDCLQETQIDIESCLKMRQEYNQGECKNDQLESNTDNLTDDMVLNTKQQSLERTTKQVCKGITETEFEPYKLKYIENYDAIDLEDINNEDLENIKGNPDSTDQREDDVEYLNESAIQGQTKIIKYRISEKKAKIKGRKFTSPDNKNGNDIAVPCNKCNKIFLNAKALRVHQRISHIPDERKCTCNLCGSKFTRYCNMYKHMRTFHGPDSVTLMRKPAEGDNVYECDKCPKKYSNKKSLSYHIKTKHLISPDVKSNSQTNLSKTKTKSIDKGSLCPICGSSFTSKTQLTVHIRRHTGERPFKCELCDRAFLLVTQLNSHKRVHTGEKPYKCQLCAKAFRVSGHLRQHMRSHTDDRPYKCSQCDRSFKYSQDLSKHLRFNRSERPNGRICDKSLHRCNKKLVYK